MYTPNRVSVLEINITSIYNRITQLVFYTKYRKYVYNVKML